MRKRKKQSYMNFFTSPPRLQEVSDPTKATSTKKSWMSFTRHFENRDTLKNKFLRNIKNERRKMKKRLKTHLEREK